MGEFILLAGAGFDPFRKSSRQFCCDAQSSQSRMWYGVVLGLRAPCRRRAAGCRCPWDRLGGDSGDLCFRPTIHAVLPGASARPLPEVKPD